MWNSPNNQFFKNTFTRVKIAKNSLFVRFGIVRETYLPTIVFFFFLYLSRCIVLCFYPLLLCTSIQKKNICMRRFLHTCQNDCAMFPVHSVEKYSTICLPFNHPEKIILSELVRIFLNKFLYIFRLEGNIYFNFFSTYIVLSHLYSRFFFFFFFFFAKTIFHKNENVDDFNWQYIFFIIIKKCFTENRKSIFTIIVTDNIFHYYQ